MNLSQRPDETKTGTRNGMSIFPPVRPGILDPRHPNFWAMLLLGVIIVGGLAVAFATPIAANLGNRAAALIWPAPAAIAPAASVADVPAVNAREASAADADSAQVVQPQPNTAPEAQANNAGGQPNASQPDVAPAAAAPAIPAVPAGPLYSETCTQLNWQKDSVKYRLSNGEYKIPVADLQSMAGSLLPGLIYMEGEDSGIEGIHHVASIYADGGGSVTTKGSLVDGKFQFRQAAFWACPLDQAKGVTEDVILGTSAWKKWKNWDDQEKIGHIVVYDTAGAHDFPSGKMPDLIDTGKVAASYGCDAFKKPVEQTPYALTDNTLLGTVIGAPGAANCHTIFVGQRQALGATVALYFSGAKDNFQYVQGGKFYLIPGSWGENEMQEFLDQTYPGQGLKVKQAP